MKRYSFKANNNGKVENDKIETKKRRTLDNKKASIIIASLILVLCMIGAILIQTVSPIDTISSIEEEEKKQYSQNDNGKFVIISNVSDLETFRNNVNAGTTYEGYTVYLDNDIDLSSIANWTPIGTSHPFKGTFDGNMHTIKNMTISGNGGAYGLFGSIDGNIKNLGVTNSNIRSSYEGHSVGAIVGRLDGGYIENCYSKDNVIYANSGEHSDDGSKGGIVGYINNARVTYCWNNSQITGASGADSDWNTGGTGGIVGSSIGGIISKCYNLGSIGDGQFVGGILGGGKSTTIEYCYNHGNIKGGGIIGLAYYGNTSVSHCYNISNCLPIVQRIYYSKTKPKFNNCYYLDYGQTDVDYGIAKNNSYMVSDSFINDLGGTDIWKKTNTYPELNWPQVTPTDITDEAPTVIVTPSSADITYGNTINVVITVTSSAPLTKDTFSYDLYGDYGNNVHLSGTFKSGQSITIGSGLNFGSYNLYVEDISDIYGNKFTRKQVGTYTIVPYIPEGFKHTEGESNKGYIIKDDNNNEFVWVPVDGVKCSLQDTLRDFDDQMSSGIGEDIMDPNFKTSVQKNKGFYIARYEAGVGDTSGNNVGIPLSQRGVNAWTNISQENAILSAKMMYASKKGYSSSLISGYAWDTVCEWISHSDREILDSHWWGNYRDSAGLGNNHGVLNLTGSNEYWKVYNIYDLAGNVEEFTTENYGSNSSETVTRGGNYYDSGVGVVYRYNPDITGSNTIGFRVILYKDDNKVVDINPPTIDGVEDGGEYDSSVGVTFRDNSGSCTAYYWHNPTVKNFDYVEKKVFQSGHKFTDDGWYKVEVTDGNGNKTTKIFMIDKTAPTFTVNGNPRKLDK